MKVNLDATVAFWAWLLYAIVNVDEAIIETVCSIMYTHHSMWRAYFGKEMALNTMIYVVNLLTGRPKKKPYVGEYATWDLS